MQVAFDGSAREITICLDNHSMRLSSRSFFNENNRLGNGFPNSSIYCKKKIDIFKTMEKLVIAPMA